MKLNLFDTGNASSDGEFRPAFSREGVSECENLKIKFPTSAGDFKMVRLPTYGIRAKSEGISTPNNNMYPSSRTTRNENMQQLNAKSLTGMIQGQHPVKKGINKNLRTNRIAMPMAS